MSYARSWERHGTGITDVYRAEACRNSSKSSLGSRLLGVTMGEVTWPWPRSGHLVLVLGRGSNTHYKLHLSLTQTHSVRSLTVSETIGVISVTHAHILSPVN